MQTYERELLTTVPSLNRYALHLTRRWHDAEDLVQETVVRALANRDKYEEGTNIRAWLFTVMHNNFCDQMRQRQRRREGAMTERVERASDPRSTYAHEDLHDLAKAFEKLSETAQVVLKKVSVEGLSYDDVAAQLGVPVGTVKSRLFRAREALRELME